MESTETITRMVAHSTMTIDSWNIFKIFLVLTFAQVCGNALTEWIKEYFKSE